MKKQRTKGQHYLPQSAYLDRFVDASAGDPVLWTYPIENGTVSLNGKKGITPRNLCKETYLYESPELPVNALEDLLATIELEYSQVFKDIISNRQPLDRHAEVVVALFVATLEARVPSRRDSFNRFLSDIESKIQLLEEKMGSKGESPDRRELANARRTAFAKSIMMAVDIGIHFPKSFLFLFNDSFIDSTNGLFFVTSDKPVTTYDFTMMNNLFPPLPNSPSAEWVVPLSPKLLLFRNNRGLSGYREIDANFVREANSRQLRRAKGRLISPYPLTSDILKTYTHHHRQSFLLKYLPQES